MALRRAIWLLILLVSATGLVVLVARALGAGGWTPIKLLALACFAGTAPWTGLCVANGVLGFAVLMLARDPVRATFPLADAAVVLPPIAVAVCVRNEDIGAVLAALGRLLAALPVGGATAFILSDTADPALAAAEAAAVAAFAPGVVYRRRARNTGFKAGNVMAFLDAEGRDFELALMLDADSEMSAAAVLRMARAMAAAPSLGIVQHLTVGRPAASAFTRLFQFGMRAGMRVWATGQAWWQGDSGPYWGHNALLRVAAFRAHARLAPLPDGSPILSHDQMEAAQLRAAGWGVRVLPDEDGSFESNPPALPEFIRRDLRWQAGNLQYRHLLCRPGLRVLGRWQLAQAMLMFATAPLYVAFVGLLTLASPVPAGPALAATLAWVGAIYAPKLLGYVQVLASPRQRARYGGGARFLAGAAAEVVFALLLDPVILVSRTLGMARLALGAGPGWSPQNRADRGVGWGEAARLLWPHTVLGVAAFAGLGWAGVVWAAPMLGGLLVAIPLCVLTADPRAGAWMRARFLCDTPEAERAPG